MKRSDKNNFVQKLKDELKDSSSLIVAHYDGLSVIETDKLRKEMRENGAKFKVTKNRLTKIALADTPYESIADLFVGPTAIAFTGTRPDGTPGDPVTIAKTLADFSKKNEKLVIKGGMLDGGLLSTDEIVALSKIAPREELLSRLAGGIAAPMQQFAGLLTAIPQKFAFALSALIEAGGGVADEVVEAAEEVVEAAEEVVEAAEEVVEAAEEVVEAAEEVEDSNDESAEKEKIDGEAKENEES